MKKQFIFLLGSVFLLAGNVTLAQPVAYDGIPMSSTVFVTFGDSSTAFNPGPEAVAALADAKEAAMVAIRGRTSTMKANARDDALALARAVSARNYLIGKGVSPLKITVNYASAADYIADNTTPEGRTQNQRVEIELIYVPAAR